MIRWNNDYNHGAHPNILKALEETNEQSFGGYGLDEWCERAASEIKIHLGDVDADIHFLVGGTQVNYTVIDASLRPFQSVISADSGHIYAHETGAVEHTGHKIQILPGINGKISADKIAVEADLYFSSDIKEHITQPKMVFISFPTEYGTIYSKKELLDIRKVCDKYNMYLYIDGARMGYGLGSAECDVTLADLAKIADVFYIGGTKCGALFGEALVIINNELKRDFRSCIKQNGGMLAKGWLLGLQFYTLFHDNLYLKITKQADELAMKVKAAFAKKNVPAFIESSTNQQFVVLTDSQMSKLKEKHIFEYQSRITNGCHCVRFCTSWSTDPKDVDILCEDISAL